MGKKKKPKMEYRYYQMVPGTYVFALLGEGWIREYGKGIDYLHFHNYLEIGHCVEGNGQMIFGEQVCDYHKGDFTIIPKKYPHTTNSIPNTKSHWEYLFIDEEGFLQKIFGEFSRHKKCEKLKECINSGVCFFSETEFADLSANIQELMEVMRQKEVFYQEEAEGLLASILVKIARINDKQERLVTLEDEYYMEGMAYDIVAKAMAYITQHYKEPLHIETIAKYCSISENHLRRLFAMHMKMRILEYINLVRVKESCEQLKKTDDSISDIAARCGFSTVSTFNRNFKKVMGNSPCSWRKSPENFEQQLLRCNLHLEAGW